MSQVLHYQDCFETLDEARGEIERLMARERELVDKAKNDPLRKFCKDYIAKQEISSAETISQCDWVITSAYEFIEGICDIAGYHKSSGNDMP